MRAVNSRDPHCGSQHHVERNRTLIEMRVGLCDELPVAIGPEIEWPLPGRENLGNVIAPT